MDASAYLEHLRTDIDRILATPVEAMDATVAACPGWTVRDLLQHHAGVFRFAAAQLRAEPGSELVAFDPVPDGPEPLNLFAEMANELVAELVAVDPSEHRPNWADAPDATFWFRRMAHETAIHRFDVQLTHTAPEPIDVALAVDGVDELADVFLIHAERRGITGHGESVHLHATDDAVADGSVDGGEWMFTFTPGGVEVEHTHGKGDMAVRGSASDLLLFCWNRRPVAVECFGEPDPKSWWPRNVRL